MPQFAYKARRRSGETVQGVLDVADRSAALMQIERMGLFPIMVDGSSKGAAAAAAAERSAGADISNRLPTGVQTFLKRKRKPKLQELATFTQQLSNLLNSGMPLAVALNSMTHLESKGIPNEVSKNLRQDVMEGRSLSDAMAKEPRVFSDLYVNMVRAGEQSGALVEVLRRMATHFQQFAEVQGQFITAMIYPLMVCLVGTGLMLFFIYVMLPQFIVMFQGFNVELPLPTRMLISFGYFCTHLWWLGILLIGLAIFLFQRFKATPDGRRKWDRWKMNVPIFGKVIKLNLFAQFARTLSTLLQNGVPVLTALQITEQVIPNSLLKEAIAKTREAVTDGKTIAQPLATSLLFPQLMVDLVKIGEETGDVPGSLANLADTYEGELRINLRIMTNIMEPLLIVVMAVAVGFLLLSVLLPMFKLISSISNAGIKTGAGPMKLNAQPGLNPVDRGNSRRRGEGFTLFEVMVVVAIMGLVLAMGIPAIYGALHRPPMSQAVHDIFDTCTEARARAILQGKTIIMRIYPKDKRIELVDGDAAPAIVSEAVTTEESPAKNPKSREFSRTLPDSLTFRLLDVNFYECKDEDAANVRFFPNGTCDEMTMVLQSDSGEYRKIVLDLVTAIAEPAPFP